MKGYLNLQEIVKLVSFHKKETTKKKMFVMKNEKHEKVEKNDFFKTMKKREKTKG
jgi:hypothetical protein